MSDNSTTNLITRPKCNSQNCFKNGFYMVETKDITVDIATLTLQKKTDINYKDPKTKPEELKKLALKLYLKGNSYRDIEDILDKQVSRQTILRWSKFLIYAQGLKKEAAN